MALREPREMHAPSSGTQMSNGLRWRMRSEDIPWPARVRMLALWALSMLLIVIILVLRVPVGGRVMLQEGDVAPADVAAPRQVTYVSEILTQQRQDLAAKAVEDVYDPPQARIGRQQLALANQILDLIATVRSDTYADLAAKRSVLDAVAAIDLPGDVVDRALTLSEPAWDRVAAEIRVVLERIMREEIRESTLADERRKVAARVRLDMPDEDAAIVSELVQGLLVPNSFFNAAKTEERRTLARDAVEPVTATVERNETILRAGDIVKALDIEALEALGLRQTVWSWKDVGATTAFVLLLGGVLLYYLWRQEPQFWVERAEPLILALTIVVFTGAAKAMIPTHTLLPYIFPYAALSMLLAILVGLRVALIVAALSVLMVGWMTGGNVELMVYALVGPVVGALKVRRGERLASYAWATGYVVAANLLVVVAFRMTESQWDLPTVAELLAAAIANGLLAMTVALVGVYLIGALFGVTTSLQLLEISRPTHPLLRQLLLKAPGTYHHTLIVSNMAERAAEAIGADALLTRVGAYYHDVGKTIRPFFFIENRSEGVDPHARLDSYTSAQVIIAHVRDGLELARKYRLPKRVMDFIPEHHGTLLVSYFYHQAVKQAGSAPNGTGPSADAVDRSHFQYAGPKPRTRETAITMLADGAEATVRSNRPPSLEDLERLVGETIRTRVLSGQLDDCPLTLEDLNAIRQAFVDVLRGLQHPRITYPSEASSERSALTGQAPVTAPGQGDRSSSPGEAPLTAPGQALRLPVQAEEQFDESSRLDYIS